MSKPLTSAPHENVRIIVVDFLKKLLKNYYRKAGKTLLINLLDTSPEIVPVLLPQEVYVKEGSRKIDFLLGSGEVVFELKGNEREFDDATEKALKEYLPEVRNAQYLIITNFQSWRIYQVKKNGKLTLKPIALNIDPTNAGKLIETQILPSVHPLIPATPEAVKKVFLTNIDDIVNAFRIALDNVKNNPRVSPFIKAYKEIMKMLYGSKEEKFLNELLIKHTIMQVISIAALTRALGKAGNPEDVCSGALLDIDVALPYLNWWRIIYVDNRYVQLKNLLNNALSEIIERVNMLDWKRAEAEDVFRTLYEVLIDSNTRRRIGEYYTPLWLVEFVLSHFKLKGKIVLDPFCGSGTFLVMAFHRKIDEGEDPVRVLGSVVGFDINPLAVTIARSELILAYIKRTGSPPPSPPRIYHTDTLARLFPSRKSKGVRLSKVGMLENIISENIANLVNFSGKSLGSSYEIFDILGKIENVFSYSTAFAYKKCELNKQCLINEIKINALNRLKKIQHPLAQAFSHILNELAQALADIIIDSGGNRVWSIVLMSIAVPWLIYKFRPHIIVTNPPWIPLTEYNAPYAQTLRNYLMSIFDKFAGKHSTAILNGSDVATAALAKSLKIAEEGVGFIMNREQLFYHRSSTTAGIFASYCVIMNSGYRTINLFDIDFDAFQHGIYPAVIIAKKRYKRMSTVGFPKVNLFIIKPNKQDKHYHKSLRYKEIRDIITIDKCGKSYEDYVTPAKLYFTRNDRELANTLGVSKVFPMGIYIRGVFGGEKKRGKKQYAGIALYNHREVEGEFEFQLYNTTRALRVPLANKDEHDIDVYRLIYVSEINPFCLRRLIPVLLSRKGKRDLCEFLRKAIYHTDTLSRPLPIGVRNKVESLIEEVEQPSSIDTLTTSNYYVVYRADRAFTASMIKPPEKTILFSQVAGMEVESEEKALYYVAILNYLAWKIVEEKRSFLHHQYGKPLIAIVAAGLCWNHMDQDIKNEVVEYAKRLINKKELCKKFSNQKMALNTLINIKEFKRIIQKLDSVVDKQALESALNLVSGSRKQ